MAGESARESARRQREKAERLRKSAELWERGAAGEERTAEVLAQLPAEHWTVFHDLRWPGRQFANVDHVVVGPPGLFVVDSKNWAGTITLKDGVLRCNGYNREREVGGAAEAARAVAQLVPELSPELARAVLCFVRDEELTSSLADVMVTSTPTLVPMLLSQRAVLSPDEVRQLSLDLEAGIRQATAAPTSVRAAGKPSRRQTSSTSRRPRSSRLGQLVAGVMVLAVVFVPGVREPVQGWVSGFFTSVAQGDEQRTEPKNEKKGKQENRRDKPGQNSQ